MITLLERLRDSGNTVLVVEHDPAVMAHADQIIEIGPDAGADGGRLVFQGTFDELRQRAARRQVARSAGSGRSSPTPRTATGASRSTDATRNNLRNVTVGIPTGVLTVLTGRRRVRQVQPRRRSWWPSTARP